MMVGEFFHQFVACRLVSPMMIVEHLSGPVQVPGGRGRYDVDLIVAAIAEFVPL